MREHGRSDFRFDRSHQESPLVVRVFLAVAAYGTVAETLPLEDPRRIVEGVALNDRAHVLRRCDENE